MRWVWTTPVGFPDLAVRTRVGVRRKGMLTKRGNPEPRTRSWARHEAGQAAHQDNKIRPLKTRALTLQNGYSWEVWENLLSNEGKLPWDRILWRFCNLNHETESQSSWLHWLINEIGTAFSGHLLVIWVDSGNFAQNFDKAVRPCGFSIRQGTRTKTIIGIAKYDRFV